MNNFAVKELYSEKHVSLPSINSLLKISLALILFTVISTALVYAETMSVDVDGTTFDFEYVATGLTVTSVEPDSGFGSLLFTVDITDSVGTLNVVLERSFLDSTFNGEDDPFIIINQFGEDLIFTESTTSQSRTLNIELPVGTIEVDVIGTSFNNPISTNDSETDDKAAADKATPTQCGPGTILKNGACVLDERCGPGTILKDGACVIDPTQSSGSTSKGMTKESLMGFVIAFVVAGIIAVVFGIIAKASKSS
jgi:hypothetical protein